MRPAKKVAGGGRRWQLVAGGGRWWQLVAVGRPCTFYGDAQQPLGSRRSGLDQWIGLDELVLNQDAACEILNAICIILGSKVNLPN